MGKLADTCLEGIKAGGCSDFCWETVPLRYGAGYEGELDILFGFTGEEECLWMKMSGDSGDWGEGIREVNSYEAMYDFVQHHQAYVGSALQEAAPSQGL